METAYDYPVVVNARYLMRPSPIPKFDNPKLDRCPALLLFGAGREKRIYAVPPHTRVRSLDFEDHPFTVETWDRPCALCGAEHVYLDEVAAWGIEALETAMRGVTARKAVHICYGYGTPTVLKWKQQNTDWGHYGVTLPLLARSSVDQVSVETAASGVDVSVLATLRGKDVLVGVVDVGTDDVEARCLAALDTYAPLTVDRVYRTRDRLLTGRSPR